MRERLSNPNSSQSNNMLKNAGFIKRGSAATVINGSYFNNSKLKA